MLTNNYKPLLSFYRENTFKDVLGNTVDIKKFLGGHGQQASVLDGQGTNARCANNHEWRGSTLSYNYDPTTGSNSYTNEQTTYKWSGVVSTVASGSSVMASLLYNGFVLFAGIGDTAPKATDYKLATPVELDVTSASCMPTSNGKTYVQRTFTNNTGADVTIKEVGCYVFACASSISASGNEYPIVMIGRTVLDTPVTIADGDSQTFTYVIENVIQ